MLALALSLVAAGLLAQPIHAAESLNRYERKAEGWNWYQDPVEKKGGPATPEEKPGATPEKKPVPGAKPEVSKEAKGPGSAPFSVKWLRENYDRLRDEAIDNPDDKEKMQAYLYAQRIILDKSQSFATAANLMSSTDPLLDETNRIPLDTAAKFAVIRGHDAAKLEALKDLATRGGIFFFFDSSCAYCPLQLQALEWLRKEHGFAVKSISTDGRGLPGMDNWVRDAGHARALGLRITPTTVFVMPPSGYYIISQGFHSAETLGEKILMVAGSKSLLRADLAKRIDIFQRGVVTPGDLRDPALATATGQDTKAWVKVLQEKIGGRQ